MSSRLLLGIETSCDDTCAAVVAGDEIRSNVISSQAAAHARYGGVVPEVASRHHVELMRDKKRVREVDFDDDEEDPVD